MPQEEIIKGLMCPGCGGSVEIKEGNNVLKCPYCGTSLMVMGDEGVLRYYVKSNTDRERAKAEAVQWFGKFDKDRKLKKEAQFIDVFLIHIPFWRSMGRVCGWVFGNMIHHETHEDSKGRMHTTTTREPVERMVMEEYLWNRAACDVSEFGVEEVDASGISGNLEPFDFHAVEKQGMVFEPTHSKTDAVKASEEWMLQKARESVRVDEVLFQKMYALDKKLSIVYYPLWVLRYKFRERSYQVVIDGKSGRLLYGRAPGSTLYRVGVFVGSLMIGNLILTTSLNAFSGSDGSEILIGAAIAGAALILFGFFKFRYGGEVVDRGKKALSKDNVQNAMNAIANGDINKFAQLPGVR